MQTCLYIILTVCHDSATRGSAISGNATLQYRALARNRAATLGGLKTEKKTFYLYNC